VARKRPTASDVQQVLADYEAGNAEDLVSAGAAPGPDASLSPAQMRALRRSDRLTPAECVAHRERNGAPPAGLKGKPSQP
jgi:hypothetical protein